jgi:glycine/D-amino acid oxidase-like deaminating enzyme
VHRGILGRGPLHTSIGGRRAFLRHAAAAATSLSVGRVASAAVTPSLAPVLVNSDRVTRTIVGLRPFRPSGFVVRADKLRRHTVVHNYGHGGAGVTLSWGTSQLAFEEVQRVGNGAVAVLGCGICGLTSALLLLRSGREVTIYAENLPPNTTSNIAGALWFPTGFFDKDKATPEFLEQFRRAARISQRVYQTYANDPRYGVYWIRLHELRNAMPAGDPLVEGNDLYPGYATVQDPDRYFGSPYTVRFDTLMIDPDIYLRTLMSDFFAAGGRIVQRHFEAERDVFDLREKIVVNCTGLGAGKLFGDEEITPVRGQLTMLLPQDDIDYGYVSGGTEHGLLYMFPRKTGIVLGGTSKRGDWSLEPDPVEKNRMLAGHAALAARL